MTILDPIIQEDCVNPLSFGDALRLYESPDIFTLGELANALREQLHGRNAYYNINRHINYTNYCVLRCKFCSFYRPYSKEKAELDDTYELSVPEMIARSKEAYDRGATEVHIVGGLHPKLSFDYYLEMCAGIRQACPHLHIKAFTAIEIIHFTRIAKPRLSIAEVLTKLQEAGLGSMPGGGAEIFDDRVHDEAFKNKVGEAEWFDVHRAAHELGIFTNATMLYGHVETPGERIKHLIKLREHQAESLRSRRAHFNCVIPLSFVPDGSALSHLPGPSGLDDLKTLAISRLVCTNIPHIKAFWIMQTPKLAQVSLNWGVDDIDGTVVYYDITKREGNGTTHQELTVDRLKRLIVEAGCAPVERDTLYRRVIREECNGIGLWGVNGEAWRVKYDVSPPESRRTSTLQIVALNAAN
ncbi:MAG: CofH family radical SAM protein [Planctomycetes bacterium]|nr:CofH family radical SAM protein [Planctomycetota bacterium]MBI3833542.1 CofH family radical SAM protein [Planctomycetota bacterium]